jgi:hypothetical protein
VVALPNDVLRRAGWASRNCQRQVGTLAESWIAGTPRARYNLFHMQSGRKLANLIGIWIAAIGVTGCGPTSSVDQPVPEIRGAPIRTIAAKSAEASQTARATDSTNQVPTNRAARVEPPFAASPPAASDKPVPLSFDQLGGYTFEVTDELLGPVTNDLAAVAQKTNSKIPETVKSYDQKKVALRGFMLPLKVEGGLVTEMLIMKDQTMCCYGATPRINDWVSVRMKSKGVRPLMDLPVTLFGTMRVGEMRENGYLVGIYSMDGDNLEATEGQ